MGQLAAVVGLASMRLELVQWSEKGLNYGSLMIFVACFIDEKAQVACLLFPTPRIMSLAF